MRRTVRHRSRRRLVPAVVAFGIVALAAGLGMAGALESAIRATADPGAQMSVHPEEQPALAAARIRTAPAPDVFAGGITVPANTSAVNAARSLADRGDAAAATAARTIAAQPTAVWLGDWLTDAALTDTIDRTLHDADVSGTTPVFVTYAIPDRDCGAYSKGGYTPTQYRAWANHVADELRGHRAAVIVEPDSLALLSTCPEAASTRLPLLRDEVIAFHDAGIPAYLDGGNSHWIDAATMADRLRQAGIDQARGFFTNVSNYYPTADERAYATQLSSLLGGAHYVIDTSRNGRGWTGTWCNAPSAGLGLPPSVVHDGTALDALLWIKPPGESDGPCDGHPAAGAWDAPYATQLVANRAIAAQ